MPNDDFIRGLLRSAEGSAFHLRFADGQEMTATVVSVSHVDLDGTVIVKQTDATAAAVFWNVDVADIAGLIAVDAG